MCPRGCQSNKEVFLNQTLVLDLPRLMNLGGSYGREGAKVMLRTHSMTGEEEVEVQVGAGADLQPPADDDGVGAGLPDGTAGGVVHGGL